jgi:hypothetical protein
MHKTFWWENPKKKRLLVSLRPRWGDNIKMDLKNLDRRVWTGYI